MPSFKVLVIAGIAVGTVCGGALALVLKGDSPRLRPTAVTAQMVSPPPAPITQPNPLPPPTVTAPAPTTPPPEPPGPAPKIVSTPSPAPRTPKPKVVPPVASTSPSNNSSTSTDADALYKKGLTLMYAGKYEEALQLLDTAYALAPNSKKLFAKATVYTQVGRFGEALQFIRTMPRIEANPDILARGRKLEQTILAECAKQNLRCE